MWQVRLTAQFLTSAPFGSFSSRENVGYCPPKNGLCAVGPVVVSRRSTAAEKMDHHPDWSNVYKTVDVTLNTHDSGGVTALDIELAKKMNRYFGG